jgi:hypothetical protein
VAAAFGLSDWIDSARSADRYNARQGLAMTIMPTALGGRDRERGHGVALVRS